MAFTKKRVLLFVLVIALGVGGFFSVRHITKVPRPNIILIVIDTLRADYLSCYGNEKVNTPNIDQLAREGILFENCISHIPITLPSHFSMFYSMMPHEYEVYNNGDRIRLGYPPLAELLRREGYQTAGIVSLGVLHRSLRNNIGFEYYDDTFNKEKGLWYRRADEITESALRWLEEHRGERFFLWLHYSDPHQPYGPPQIDNDFQVYLNGNLLQEIVLNTQEIYRINLHLRPGRNMVKFDILPAEGRWGELLTERVFPALLESIHIEPDEGIELRYTETIVPSSRLPGRLELRSPAYLEIINKHPREVESTLCFSGMIKWTTESIARLYAMEVEYADKSLGRLFSYLKKRKLDRNLILLLTSDHGEGLGDHNLIGHIDQLYDSLLKVPLIIKAPTIKGKNRRISELVGLMDISPTILDLLKLPQPEWMQGQSLLSRMSWTAVFQKETPCFSETFTPEAPDTKFSVRSSRWKLIYTPRSNLWELYDLAEDENELRNIFSRDNLPTKAQLLYDELNNKFKGMMDLEIYGLKKGIDPKTLRMLKSLGYLK